MERGNSAFREIELIEDNHNNQFSSSIYIEPEIMLSNKVGEPDMIQDNVVQHLLYRVEKEKEESQTNQSSPSIRMAPRILRDVNPSSFNPRVVSIGPLHREDENVQAFEKQKSTYLMRLMSRFDSLTEEILKSWVQKMYDSMEQIKACYVWTKTYSDAKIADMMIMDACFMLEFMFKIRYDNDELRKEGILLPDSIMFDLVLLENQIPFFILNEIYQRIPFKFKHKPPLRMEFKHKPPLFELIQPLLKAFNPFEEDIKFDNITVNNTHHILSLLHQCYKPPDHIKKGYIRFTIPSVSNLDKAGVNFKPSKNPTWLMGMELELSMFPCIFGFWSKPALRMPVLLIQDSTELVLRNLVAYEQAGITDHSYFTSYTFAVDKLIDTQEDVSMLVESGILVNIMGSNDEAANIINTIGKEIILGDFFYEEEWVKLRKHCDGYWPKNIAKMRRTYFSSPWSMIALVAGIILFALTIVQTIFTIKSA